MKAYEAILTETSGARLLKVTLNQPELGNAKNTRMGLDLLDPWTSLSEDPGDIRCVIPTCAGDRSFCTGGDLKQRRDLNPKQWRHQQVAPYDTAAVERNDGRAIAGEPVARATGHPTRPVTDARLYDKFADCLDAGDSDIPADVLFKRLPQILSISAPGRVP